MTVVFFRADTACCNGTVCSKWFLVCHEREKEENGRKDLSPTNNVSNLCGEWRISALLTTILIILEGYKARAIYHCALTLLPLLLKQGLLQRESYGLPINLCHEIFFRQLVREQSISQMHVLLERITYTMLAIDLGFHDSWQKIYLQRFDYIYSGNLWNVASKIFANYREVQDLSPTLSTPQIMWPRIEASLSYCARDTDHECRVPLRTPILIHFSSISRTIIVKWAAVESLNSEHCVIKKMPWIQGILIQSMVNLELRVPL